MKWLESLAEKQGAKAEELITHPAERTDAVPSWATQTNEQPTTPAAAPVQSLPQPTPVQPSPPPSAAVQPAPAAPVQSPQPVSARPSAAPVQPPPQPAPVQPPVAPKKPMAQDDPNFVPGPLSALVSGPGTSAAEQDDAMRWLESLAEKQGAKAEELITHPDERTDAVPSWATQTDEQPTPPAAAPVQPPTPPAAVQPEPVAQDDDTLAWLQGLAAGEAMSQAPADVSAEPPVSQPVAGRMPWEQEETPAQPAEELPWETKTPPVEQSAPGAEPQLTSDVSEWLKNLDMQDQGQPASSLAPAAVPADQLPDWLNPAQQDQAADDGLPEWLKDTSADEQPAAPTAAATWIPDSQATPPAADESPRLIFSPPLEETPAPPAPVPAPTPAPAAPIPASTPTPTTPITPVRPAVRQTGMLGDKDGPVLQNARQLMAQGGLEAAVNGYVKLIKRAKFLEEIIYDLKEATYTHPVDVVIWQTLGDAHMRANQLQDALDAYTKAEELLR
jgi:hypothetical protein